MSSIYHPLGWRVHSCSFRLHVFSKCSWCLWHLLLEQAVWGQSSLNCAYCLVFWQIACRTNPIIIWLWTVFLRNSWSDRSSALKMFFLLFRLWFCQAMATPKWFCHLNLVCRLQHFCWPITCRRSCVNQQLEWSFWICLDRPFSWYCLQKHQYSWRQNRFKLSFPIL